MFPWCYLVLPLLLGDQAYRPDPGHLFHQQAHFFQGLQQHLGITTDHSIIFTSTILHFKGRRYVSPLLKFN